MATKATLTVAETLPKSFLLSCRTRGERPAMREKLYGIWNAISWNQWLERSSAVTFAPARDRLPARRRRLGAGQHGAGMELRRLRHPVRGRRLLRHLSDRFGQAARIPGQRSAHHGPVRRGRRAARQGAGRARALPDLRKIVVFDMEGLRTFSDPMVVSLDEFMAAGRNYGQGKDALFEELVASRKPDDLAILVYTSGTTGPPKGAMHSHRNVVYTMQNCMHPELSLSWYEGDERLAFLPLCHVAERIAGSYYSVAHRRLLQLRREPRDGAGQYPRGAAHLVRRRAARLGEVLRRHHDRPEGRHAAAAMGLQVGRSPPAMAIADARLARREPTALQKLQFQAGLLAGAEEHPPHDRPRPLPLAVHRRGADLARADPLVPGARPRHVRGLRPDRELRAGDGDAGRRHQARHGRQVAPYGRGQASRPWAKS